jgi:hypothetical protein
VILHLRRCRGEPPTAPHCSRNGTEGTKLTRSGLAPPSYAGAVSRAARLSLGELLVKRQIPADAENDRRKGVRALRRHFTAGAAVIAFLTDQSAG